MPIKQELVLKLLDAIEAYRTALENFGKSMQREMKEVNSGGKTWQEAFYVIAYEYNNNRPAPRHGEVYVEERRHYKDNARRNYFRREKLQNKTGKITREEIQNRLRTGLASIKEKPQDDITLADIEMPEDVVITDEDIKAGIKIS